MPAAWTPEEDRAMLLAIVQIACEDGISKSQTDAAAKKLGGKWTASAINQHYNKKLRNLSAKDLANGGDGTGTESDEEEEDGETPTPAAKGKGKAKAGAAPKKTSKKGKAAAAADDEPKAKAKGKKAAAMATFPNLKRKAASEEADGAAGKKIKAEGGADGEVGSEADAEAEDE